MATYTIKDNKIMIKNTNEVNKQKSKQTKNS